MYVTCEANTNNEISLMRAFFHYVTSYLPSCHSLKVEKSKLDCLRWQTDLPHERGHLNEERVKPFFQPFCPRNLRVLGDKQGEHIQDQEGEQESLLSKRSGRIIKGNFAKRLHIRRSPT